MSHGGSLASLLAASDEDSSSSSDRTHNTNEKDQAAYGNIKRSKLTKLQEEISYAAETINTHYFVDLGGVLYHDINFAGRHGTPLKIAATKGR